MRSISRTYEDPTDVIWLHAAAQMGMHVERAADVFASWDGRGVLRIGTPETLDPDDCLAQMIFHETCHALIEGPEAWNLPDWGLQIDNPKQRVHEHACLRLQAALASPFGLRTFLAATTNFRRYYDRLPESPLEDDEDRAVRMARIGMERATDGPLAKPLASALQLTAEIASLIQPIATEHSLWKVAPCRPDVP